MFMLSTTTKQEASLTQDTISIGGHGQAKEIIGRFLRNKAAVFGLAIVVFLLFCAIFPQALTQYDPIEQDLRNRFAAPSSEHYFGTDEYGRDIFARVIYGCRTSMEIGLLSVAVSCGSIAGYARVVRVSVLSTKGMEYVEAAYATGASDARIIFKYILPNCLAPIIVQATMSVATTIMTATGLSFLGLGVPAPTPEWGAMASSSRAYIRDYWWLVTFPGIAIMITAFSFNLFGDGLRDALDPKLKS